MEDNKKFVGAGDRVKIRRILLFKYMFLILFFINSILLSKNVVLSLIITIILIIGSNIRMFYLKEDIKTTMFLVLEVFLTLIILNNIGINVGFYLLFVTADIFYVENKNSRMLCLLFFIIAFIKNYISFENYISLGTMVIFIAIASIFQYLKELYRAKLRSEELYDKLRISEEQLKKANEELESYANSIEEIAILKEQNRISREIHDGVGHVLSTTMIQLAAMERLGGEENNLAVMAGNLREFVAESFNDVKSAIRELKPTDYESYEGLARINELCKNIERFSEMKIRFIVNGDRWGLTEKQESNIYRITQEVLANSIKHGKASKINVVFNFNKEELLISYGDNGIGTDSIKEKGVGLKSIKERVKELLGTVTFLSKRSEGFVVKIIIPKRGEMEYGEN